MSNTERNITIASAHVDKGSALCAAGNKEAAADEFRKALELHPGLAEAELGLCNTYVDMERLDDAEPYCRPVLEKFPASETAYYNYGRVMQHTNRHNEAITYYQKAIALNPAFPRPYFYLGSIYQMLGKYTLALDSYKKVAAIRPDIAPAWFRMGQMYQLLRQLDKAIESFSRVLELSQTYHDKEQLTSACVQIGFIYNKFLNNKKNAAKYFQKALEIDPEHAAARHYLAATGNSDTPDRASNRFVTQLFDEMSDNFEHALVNQLNYRTPELISEAVHGLIPTGDKTLNILDLGCGTGLCGPLFHDVSGFLAGIDLSPRMIEKAREKNIYDELIVGELTDAMSVLNHQFDVILSADVFVYIGNLADVFSACKRILTAGGLLSFSTESTEKTSSAGYVLLDSGRYAHLTDYIDRLSKEFDMEKVFFRESTIRMEGDKPINGYIYVLKNQAT